MSRWEVAGSTSQGLINVAASRNWRPEVLSLMPRWDPEGLEDVEHHRHGERFPCSLDFRFRPIILISSLAYWHRYSRSSKSGRIAKVIRIQVSFPIIHVSLLPTATSSVSHPFIFFPYGVDFNLFPLACLGNPCPSSVLSPLSTCFFPSWFWLRSLVIPFVSS